jgi:hypothetical protein
MNREFLATKDTSFQLTPNVHNNSSKIQSVMSVLSGPIKPQSSISMGCKQYTLGQIVGKKRSMQDRTSEDAICAFTYNEK